MQFSFLRQKKYHQAGFSTLEVLLATTLLIVILSGAILTLENSGGAAGVSASFAGARSLWTDSRTNSEALRLAQANLEKAQAQAQESFFAVKPVAGNGDFYKENVVVDWISDYVKKIKSKITWENDVKSQFVELETLVTSPANAARGDTCDLRLIGNWQSPKVLGTFDFTSNSGATDLVVKRRMVYLTTNPAASNKDDFYIIDAKEPLSPQKISSINTGTGLVGVAVGDNAEYAYVASVSTVNQLQIIDISDPKAPFIASQLALKNMLDQADCKGEGKSIHYKDGRVYLGLSKDVNCPEFNVIDVSDPSSPQQIAAWEAGAQITDIKVDNNRAYLALPYSSEEDETQPIKGNLIVLDISNLGNIGVIKNFSAKNKNDNSIVINQPGESVFLDGDLLYFGRSVGGVNNVNNHELFIFDRHSLQLKGSVDIGSSVNAVIPRGGFLFMATSAPNLGFQIWNGVEPQNISPYGSLNIQQASTGGMGCEENLIYVAQRSNAALQIIGPGDFGVDLPTDPDPETFAYTITHNFNNNSSPLTINKGAVPAVAEFTITMISGSPKKVTVTAPNPNPAIISITPNNADCTPGDTAPYACKVVFNYSTSTTNNVNYSDQTAIGDPGSVESSLFKITLKK